MDLLSKFGLQRLPGWGFDLQSITRQLLTSGIM